MLEIKPHPYVVDHTPTSLTTPFYYRRYATLLPPKLSANSMSQPQKRHITPPSISVAIVAIFITRFPTEGSPPESPNVLGAAHFDNVICSYSQNRPDSVYCRLLSQYKYRSLGCKASSTHKGIKVIGKGIINLMLKFTYN